MSIGKVILGAALLAGTTTSVLAADRARATLSCKALPSPEFAYDCTVDLANARTGAPLEGATIILGADMPSMPMVHNVPPFEFKT
ncbi:MAG: hypothetical protein J0I57_21945, partial [Hyphomicrobium sp.]|nr:hypothetical protein [Hyphomicrobium sp.]